MTLVAALAIDACGETPSGPQGGHSGGGSVAGTSGGAGMSSGSAVGGNGGAQGSSVATGTGGAGAGQGGGAGFGGSPDAGSAGVPIDGGRDAAGSGPAMGSGPEVSPVLVGQSYWGESDIEALWPVVKTSGVKLIRYGGAGPDAAQPSNQRYAAVATAIRAIGAEPFLQISRHFDATRAQQIVDYVNRQQALHVTHWCINNEPDLGANEPQMSVSDTANLIKSLASAMKQTDPTIQIWAPELAYYDEAYLGPMLGGASDITGKDASGRYYVDGISFHTYPFGATYTRSDAMNAAAGFRGSVVKLLAALDQANQKNGRAGSAPLKWALTEFNITYQNPADNSVDGVGVHSFFNGQFFAELFGVGMANRALTMDPWSVHESNGSRNATDLGYLDGPLSSAKPRSSYYHLQLVAQNFRGRYAPATSTQSSLRVLAAGDGTQVSVLLLNESLDQSYDFGIRLDGGTLAQPRSVTVAVNASLAAEYAGSIPPQSSALYVFDASGKPVRRVEYAIADARSAQPPRETTP
jgi:hypothetical protein